MLCPAPFIHRVVMPDGHYNICCSARHVNNTDYDNWNGKSYQKIRKHMLEETELPSECVVCKHQEEGGKSSYREQMFHIYEKLDEPAPDIETGTAIDAPISLDLRMNNLCNLSCRMCSPRDSSSIVKEAKKHPELWPIMKKYNPKEINFQEILDNVGAIYDLRLVGGEPSVQHEAMIILEELIRLKKTNIDLFVTTNGTNTNPRFYDLLENFTKLRITVSIDGWGKQHEYIRGPAADWDTIWKNVKKIKAYEITIQQTITTLNIFDFWRLEKNNDTDIEIRPFVAVGPAAYTPINMPDKWKQRAMDIAKENGVFDLYPGVWNVLNTQGNVDELKGFKHRTEMMDRVRKQYLIDHFPITHEMLEDIG
jgi:MoaA/NifB/PqqE/SkfB family radical SAM enzyme